MRRLKLASAICAALAVAGLAALIGGIAGVGLDGDASLAAVGIAFGGLTAIFAGLFAFLLHRTHRLAAALARGEGVIASWRVSPSALAAYRANEAARRRDERSDYRPAAREAEAWTEVRFSEKGVLIGDHYYFGLLSSGLQRFTAVRMVPEQPVCIEFSTAMDGLSYGGVALVAHHRQSALRIPGAAGEQAQMALVLHHFRDVLAGRRLVDAGYWPGLIRWSLIVAATGLLGAIAAYVCAPAYGSAMPDLSFTLIALGAGACVGGLVTAGLFSLFARQQRGARRSGN